MKIFLSFLILVSTSSFAFSQTTECQGSYDYKIRQLKWEKQERETIPGVFYILVPALGGAVGFAVGGPPGAVAGVAIGVGISATPQVAYQTSASLHLNGLEKARALLAQAAVGQGIQLNKAYNEVKNYRPNLTEQQFATEIVTDDANGVFCPQSDVIYSYAAMIEVLKSNH